MITKMLTASVISLGMISSAMAVTCPTASDITGTADSLNAVIRQTAKTYFVLSAGPAVNANDLDWMVLSQTSAKGFDAAYANGKKSVESVLTNANEDAIEQGGMLICGYLTSSGGMNVMAVSQEPQENRLFFNPTKINMDKLKFNK